MIVDNDEKMEGMCPKCVEEVTSTKKCIRCGITLSIAEKFTNPNFDSERFERLAGENNTDL